MKTFEKWIASLYCVLVVVIYLLALLRLTMYTTHDSKIIALVMAIITLPAAVYITIRIKAADADGGKWYRGIGYFVIFFLGLMFTGYFSAMKADLLLPDLLKPSSVDSVSVLDLKKDYVRKIGWDHTDITLLYKGHKEVFVGSRTSFFLLQQKKHLVVTTGQSFTGNYYITDLHLSSSERWAARLAYCKDWSKRNFWIPIIILVVLLAIRIRVRFWPDAKPIQLSWQRVLSLITGITAAILLLAYFALLIYIKFIHPH